MNETGPAKALVEEGSADGHQSWGIGSVMGAGSWSVLDASDPKRKPDGSRVLWRNFDTSGPAGDLWFQKGRFGTIAAWFPKHVGNWWADALADLAALRVPVVVPWDSSWVEPGGTQGQAVDNGVIILLGGGLRYEIQGMAQLGPVGAAATNARTFGSGLPNQWHYRCDGLFCSVAAPTGSQGPIGKLDGLMRPSYLTRPADPKAAPLRLSVWNVQWGPGATAVKPGWVEHPGPVAPHGATFAGGNNPDAVPCFQPFRVEITDAQIERWLTDEKATGVLLQSKRQFAQNLRGDGVRATLRVAETGTFTYFIESSGASERPGWAAAGVPDERAMNDLGRNLFRYGRLVAVTS